MLDARYSESEYMANSGAAYRTIGLGPTSNPEENMKSRLLPLVCVILYSMIAGANAWPWSKSPEQQLKEKVTMDLGRDKQKWFKIFHPLGTATSVTVHEVAPIWSNDRPDANVILGFSVRFTIYWGGPVTTDGYTKVFAIYDKEVGRYVDAKIISTNGITNQQSVDGLAQLFQALASP